MTLASFIGHRAVRRVACGGALLACALALATGAVSCGDDGASPTRRSAAPGIVLICMDTLRLDATTGKAPDGKPAMPRFDAFAKTATTFADASAGSSWTAPSVATLLSGLDPGHTGVRGSLAAAPLPGLVTTLAESLHDKGYATAAFTAGGWLIKERGYGQGFDAFETTFDSAGPDATIAAWQATRKKDAPFFLFLHTCAAHDPYGPKEHEWTEAESLPDVAAQAKVVLERTQTAGWKFTSEDAVWVVERFLLDARARASMGYAMGHMNMLTTLDRCLVWMDGEGRGSKELLSLIPRARDGYRAGLSYADQVLGRTLDGLAASGLPEGTIIAVVGDHGEGLGEHGILLHGRWLYDDLVRVPFALRAPGRLPAGAVVRGSCGLVDVAPTLLHLADVKPPAGVDGRSLLKLARGEETGHPISSAEDRHVASDGPARVQRTLGVRTEAAKFLLTFDARTFEVVKTELYDLVADPTESTSLPAASLERFGSEFCRAVARLYASVPGIPAPAPCGN